MYQLWVFGVFDNVGWFMQLGCKMVEFFLDFLFGKMFFMGYQFKCMDEVFIIVFMFFVLFVFFRFKDCVEESDVVREKFFVLESDYLMFLNVYQQWKSN